MNALDFGMMWAPTQKGCDGMNSQPEDTVEQRPTASPPACRCGRRRLLDTSVFFGGLGFHNMFDQNDQVFDVNNAVPPGHRANIT